jgi:hypothetical protein
MLIITLIAPILFLRLDILDRDIAKIYLATAIY